MLTTWKRSLGVLSGFVMAAALAVPAQAAKVATPGTVNYIEGQVLLNGSAVTSKSVGSAEVGRDQVLQTDRGKAEMLLTPGVFVRLDEHSAVRMVSPELIDTQVEVTKGKALIEVTDLLKNKRLTVRDNGATATLKKNGVYAFNADQPYVRVFDGKADVVQNDQHVELNKGKELNLNQPLKAQKFDRKAAQESDSLYRWSSLRSQYLEQASIDASRVVVVNHAWGGP